MLNGTETDWLSMATDPSGSIAADPNDIDSRIRKIGAAHRSGVSYYRFTSTRSSNKLPIFIAVHGISRCAIDQARLFAPFIEAVGGTLVAPIFSKKRFSGYQRLGSSGKGCRPDLALRQMIADVHASQNRPNRPVVMFGYSGGGQFVHRYAMAYPRQVLRMAIAAAGWFTFPDRRLRFPEGIKQTTKLPDLTFDNARFLKIPTLVLVGANDTERDAALNKGKRLDQRQGDHRVARARRWIDAMKSAARQFRYDTPYHSVLVPDCGHSFRDCMTKGAMGWQIIRFLYEAYNQQRDPAVSDTSVSLVS